MIELIEVIARSERTRETLLRELPKAVISPGGLAAPYAVLENVTIFFVSGQWGDAALSKTLHGRAKIDSYGLYNYKELSSVLILKDQNTKQASTISAQITDKRREIYLRG